jgi:methionine-S-sulfoxide reductase
MKKIGLILILMMSFFAEAKNMKKEIATLAGGCFWGMEEILRSIKGISKTTVGYTGGKIENPKYELVKLGTSQHAESVEIEFDPSVISFSEVLNYFFRMHDPTTVNQQGNDKGTQYRSAIFYHSEEQKQVAREMIEKVNASKKWPKPIVTEVVPATKFYPAEDYHQDYLQKNPGGYTCHWLRN